MFCTKCGTNIPDGSAFCTKCGAPVGQPAGETQQAPQQTYAQPQYAPVLPRSVSFVDAIKLFFKHYADFEGRATKSEYWFAFLFQMVVSLATGWIPVIGWLISVALFIPNLSISIRRLHDIGKSWVYYLMGLIPFAGIIILIVYYCKDSDGPNQWGPVPTSLDELNK